MKPNPRIVYDKRGLKDALTTLRYASHETRGAWLFLLLCDAAFKFNSRSDAFRILEVLKAQPQPVRSMSNGATDVLVAGLVAYSPEFVSVTNLVELSSFSQENDVFRLGKECHIVASCIGAFASDETISSLLQIEKSREDRAPGTDHIIESVHSSARFARRFSLERPFLEDPLIMSPEMHTEMPLYRFRTFMRRGFVQAGEAVLDEEIETSERIAAFREIWFSTVRSGHWEQVVGFWERKLPSIMTRFEDQILNTNPPVFLHFCIATLLPLVVSHPDLSSFSRLLSLIGSDGIRQCSPLFAKILGALIKLDHTSDDEPFVVTFARALDTEEGTVRWSKLVAPPQAHSETDDYVRLAEAQRARLRDLIDTSMLFAGAGDRETARVRVLQAFEELDLSGERDRQLWVDFATAWASTWQCGDELIRVYDEAFEWSLLGGAIRSGNCECAIQIAERMESEGREISLPDIVGVIVANDCRDDSYVSLVEFLIRNLDGAFGRSMLAKVFEYTHDLINVLEILSDTKDIRIAHATVRRLVNDGMLEQAKDFLRRFLSRCGEGDSVSVDVAALYVMIAARQRAFGLREQALTTVLEAQGVLPDALSLTVSRIILCPTEQIPILIRRALERLSTEVELVPVDFGDP